MALTDTLKKGITWSLLLCARVLPNNSETFNWVSNQNSDNIPEANPYRFDSLCNTQGHFLNKFIYYNPAIESQNLMVEQIRYTCEKTIEKKIKDLESLCKSKEQTLFKSNNNFVYIKNYLKLIVDLVEQAKIRRHYATGYCGEAAAASVVNTLLKQLQTGKRESVQLLTITDQNQDVGHVFVLYNSTPLKSQWLDNEKLKTILTNARSPENENPVICDEFSHLHDIASIWPKLFFNAKDHLYGKADYVYLDVVDCSLPPLHKLFNHKQRTFIKETLLEILSQVKMCDVDENILNCRH